MENSKVESEIQKYLDMQSKKGQDYMVKTIEKNVRAGIVIQKHFGDKQIDNEIIQLLTEIRNNIRFDIPMPQASTDARISAVLNRSV